MKKILLVIFALFLVTAGIVYAMQSKQTANKGALNMNNKVLIVYFSATGTTKKVAENLAKATGGDLYEIKPLQPYTREDLDWTNDKSRSSVEMKNKKYRPEIVDDNFSVSEYDTVFLGFPIWWGVAPTVVNTFLEKHAFSNKTIIFFATSGGSGFGRTAFELKQSVSSSTKITEGILNNNPSVEYFI